MIDLKMSNQLSNYDFNMIPFDRIVKVGQRSMIDKDTFVVSWILGRFCNYHCSYCWTHSGHR